MPEPAQFRTAHLRIKLHGKQNVRIDDVKRRCQQHIADCTLIRVIISLTKSEIPLRNQPYTGINLYVQAREKTLSNFKLGKLFGANIQLVLHGKATKNSSLQICSGFCKDSAGIWVKDEQVCNVEEFVQQRLKSRNATNLMKQDESVPDFDCPICLNMMEDPVLTSAGHSYCKSCIEKVFANCKRLKDLKGRHETNFKFNYELMDVSHYFRSLHKSIYQ